jgi:short-subunit dehydrogenase
MRPTFETILITGASSGLGAALARAYASSDRTLVLWGRDRARLEVTAEECRRAGANVETESFDIADLDRMTAALIARDGRSAIDLAIFNAGLGGVIPAGSLAEDPARSRAIAMVDFASPVVAASVLAERMSARRRGQIALIGSIAESFPLPMAPTYAGAKAGLGMFADALRLRMRRHGVSISLVVPGFIDTPMSRSVNTAKPFLMSPDKAAALIKARLTRRAARFVLPWQFSLVRAGYRLLPKRLTALAIDRFDQA